MRSDRPFARSTDTRRDTPQEQALRKACANSMVVGLMDMMQPEGKLIITVAGPWEQWFGRSNQRLRDTSQSTPWLQEQLSGTFAKTMVETFKCLVEQPKPAFCEFALPPAESAQTMNPEEVTGREGELARTMAHLALGVNWHRIKRCTWMLLGASPRSCLMLLQDDRAQQEIQRLRRDWSNYKHLQSVATNTLGAEALLKWSPFNMWSVRQVVLVLEAHDFQLSGLVLQWLSTIHRRLLGSQVCEGGFNEQNKAANWRNRRSSLERSFATLIERQALSTKHRFEEVPQASAPAARNMHVPVETYRGLVRAAPECFREVVSFKQTPEWHSPKAEDWSIPYADQVLLDRCRELGEMHLLQMAWVGAVVKPSCDMAIREVRGGRQVRTMVCRARALPLVSRVRVATGAPQHRGLK